MNYVIDESLYGLGSTTQSCALFGASPANANGPLLTGATTGNGVNLIAVGDDTNIDINLVPKGSGKVNLTATGGSGLSLSETLTGATYSASTHTDQVFSGITLTPATTVTAANGLNSIRGEVALTSGKTLGTGSASYVSGLYGRANIFGTVNIGSGDLSAVMGKMDLNGSTLTSGHIAPVQSNIVNPPASAVSGGVSLFYGESASGTPIANGIELYMGAAYLMKLTQVSGGSFFGATAPTTLAKSLKINVGGTDYYIGLYTSPS